MREHGVLRRVLIVYGEAAPALAHDAAVDARALNDAARLFRDFGENYHERVLEDQHIFPELAKPGSRQARLVATLLQQHVRGREITRFVLSRTRGKAVTDPQPLSRALASMTRMYNAHTAWEDTLVFPAWKKTKTKAQLDEASEEFENIEHKMFGRNGFDDALERMTRIEAALGRSDLARYTAAVPAG